MRIEQIFLPKVTQKTDQKCRLRIHGMKAARYINVFVFDLNQRYLVQFDRLTKWPTKNSRKTKETKGPVSIWSTLYVQDTCAEPYNPLCDIFCPSSLHLYFFVAVFTKSLGRNVSGPQTMLFVQVFYLLLPVSHIKSVG